MEERSNALAVIEATLQTALFIKGRSIKAIAEAVHLKPNTLYKWKSGSINLSLQSMERLMLYFIQHEPERLEQAEA
ncbi:MAG: hypothetical protein IKH57_08215 [Clostridia bacterium]|nr:hypothetical protein [Clostridia bacterium]MBR6028402.1 hypothetical protein [Clostridia bacterium]